MPSTFTATFDQAVVFLNKFTYVGGHVTTYNFVFSNSNIRFPEAEKMPTLTVQYIQQLQVTRTTTKTRLHRVWLNSFDNHFDDVFEETLIAH